MRKLTDKQRRFVEEMFRDSSSQRAAAIRAGYPETSASEQASRNMKLPLVREALEELRTVRKHRLGITEDSILLELRKIAYATLQDYVKYDDKGNLVVDVSNVTPEQMAAVQEISYYRGVPKIKMHDKLTALLTIAKHLGMFKAETEHNVKLSLEDLVIQSMKKPDPEKKSE